jgi:hypothetical protein
VTCPPYALAVHAQVGNIPLTAMSSDGTSAFWTSSDAFRPDIDVEKRKVKVKLKVRFGCFRAG